MLLWCHRGALPQTHQEMISLIQPGNASCVWWGVCVCVYTCVLESWPGQEMNPLGLHMGKGRPGAR